MQLPVGTGAAKLDYVTIMVLPKCHASAPSIDVTPAYRDDLEARST